MTVGYLPNAFDLINVRHLDLIAQARMHCSRLVVGVFSDDFAEQLLGRRPVVALVERMALVEHIRGVDQVVEHNGSSPVVQPDVRLFSVAGDMPLPGAADTWLLQTTRETTSAVLREALQGLRQVNVA